VSVDERIGRQVRMLMWDKRVQHRPLYTAMGVSRSALSKKLRGEIAWSADDIATAARVLGVTPNDLYDWHPVTAGAVTSEYQQTRGGHHAGTQPAAA
jgi:hypothetical protein